MSVQIDSAASEVSHTYQPAVEEVVNDKIKKKRDR